MIAVFVLDQGQVITGLVIEMFNNFALNTF